MTSEQFDFLARLHAYCAAGLGFEEMADRESLEPLEFAGRLQECDAQIHLRNSCSLLVAGRPFEEHLALGSLPRGSDGWIA